MNSTIINVLCDVLGSAGGSSECNGRCQPCPILAGDPDLSDFSVPLMDMGLDSLSAVEFRNRVQADGGMGSGDFLMNFIFWMTCLTCLFLTKKAYLGISARSPVAKPSDVAQRSLCCDNLSFN